MADGTELLATITPTSRETMDDELNSAIHTATQRAMRDGRRGILLTRVDFGSFTVELTPDVPYGYTYELEKI